MSKFTSISSLLAVYFANCMYWLSANEENIAGPISPHFRFLVNVDGKSFFADTDPETTRNWTEASAYCKSMQMNLATITSTGQWEALLNAYDDTNFQVAGYWTSGRDSLDLRQFSWDTTHSDTSALGLTFKNYRNISSGSQTCLAFHSDPNQTSFLYPRECSAPLWVLCET